jgi:serine/threonine protein kinase
VKETETDLNLTKTGRGLGTPHFMAPEQFRNAKNADVRCDVYSLGATLYQMVTGELPFRSTSGPLDAWMKKIQNDLTPPRQVVPDLSERIDWAILRAMSADPMKRPATCREFVEDLTGHSTRRVPTTDSSTPLQELWYLVYKDEMGASHTVKGSTSAIRRSLKDGLLGDASNVRASRIKAGPFEALRGFPEFRDLVVTAAPLNVPSASNTRILSPSASNSNAPTTPQFRSTPPADPAAPHIALVASPQQGPSLEWVKWVFLILIAAASAVLAFHFIPVP